MNFIDSKDYERTFLLSSLRGYVSEHTIELIKGMSLTNEDLKILLKRAKEYSREISEDMEKSLDMDSVRRQLATRSRFD
jgi:hypothetical protein